MRMISALLLFLLLAACADSEPESRRKNISEQLAEQKTAPAAAGIPEAPKPGAAEPVYWIYVNDRVYGPATAAAVRQWVLETRINVNTLVSRNGGSYRKLAGLPEFRAFLLQHSLLPAPADGGMLVAALPDNQPEPVQPRSVIYAAAEYVPPMPKTRVVKGSVHPDE